MTKAIARAGIVFLLAIMLSAPTWASSGGPPWGEEGSLTINEGCSCHGGGVPSTSVVVMVSGVPHAYEVGATYDLTIHVSTADSSQSGFLLWDGGVGSFNSDGAGVRTADGEPTAVSQSAVGNDWVIPWTAPASDSGEIAFTLVGNAVDGGGAPDESDHWNILSFMISPPGAGTNPEGEELALRTIAVGDYQSLFVVEESAEAIEQAHQDELASQYFTQGNLYYWPTLTILLVGAIFQRDFYERKFAGGPPHLDMSLAVPQGIRRSVFGLIFLYATLSFIQGGWGWGYFLVTGFMTFLCAYGVYRTVVQARAPVQVKDML